MQLLFWAAATSTNHTTDPKILRLPDCIVIQHLWTIHWLRIQQTSVICLGGKYSLTLSCKRSSNKHLLITPICAVPLWMWRKQKLPLCPHVWLMLPRWHCLRRELSAVGIREKLHRPIHFLLQQAGRLTCSARYWTRNVVHKYLWNRHSSMNKLFKLRWSPM